MKVALVNTFLTRHPTPPLGIGYICSVLKEAGHEARIFDLNIVKDFEKRIADFGPQLVGFSVPTVEFDRAIRYAKIVKSVVPGVKIVFGGPHATVAPDEVSRRPEVDFVCIGEGEYFMLDLANGKSPKTIKGLYGNEARPFIQDIDALPYPDREELGVRWYMKQPPIAPAIMPYVVVHVHRGCPFNCIYCQPTAKKMFGLKVRIRNAPPIVEESNFIKDKYKPKMLNFSADTFTAIKKWTMEFCEEYRKNGPGLPFWVNGRVGTLDREMTRALKRAGCHYLAFGIESGNQDMLNFMRRGMTIQQIKDTFKMLAEEGVISFGNIMIGTPHETEQSIRDSYNLLKEIKPDYIGGPYITNPLPGTDLYDYSVEHGMLTFGGDYSNLSRFGQGNMKIENFTTEELMKKYDEFVRMLFRVKINLLLTRSHHRVAVKKKIFNMIMNAPYYMENMRKASKTMGAKTQGRKTKILEMFIKGI